MEALTDIVPARSTHRQVVIGDLELLAERAEQLIDDRNYKTTQPEWDTLRNAQDAAMALHDLLDATEALRMEGRDVMALAEHALSVLGATVMAVEALAPEAVAA